jgi:hypothetical protein
MMAGMALWSPPLAGAILLSACLAMATSTAAERMRVGSVDKVENQAEIVSAGATTSATPGAPVHLNDELRTGPEGRLQVVLADDSILTLGEKASVRIDRYVYDPDADAGETVLTAAKGSFRFASGRIKQLKQSSISVATPVAVIGVRGTEFWGGPIDAAYGVLLLDGKVVVTNRAGSVTLASRGEGTDIVSANDVPGPVKAWSDAKIARAVASVALR